MRRLPELLPALVLLAACNAGPKPEAPKRFEGPLASQTIALPEATARFEGAGADVLNTNCLACHSREMIAYQPRLSREQWAATVKKMREVYKAPIAEGDDAAIVAALLSMQAR